MRNLVITATIGHQKKTSSGIRSIGFHSSLTDPTDRGESHYEPPRFYYTSNTYTVEEGTIFRVSYDHRGGGESEADRRADLWLCEAVSGCPNRIQPETGEGFIEGSFNILCHAHGMIRAAVVSQWWENRPSDVDDKEFALHCAKHVESARIKCPSIGSVPLAPWFDPWSEPEIVIAAYQQLQALNVPLC